MPEIRYITWEENEADHAADRREMIEAVASGRKTARQVQAENSLIPLDAKIEIDWQDLSERLERAHVNSLKSKQTQMSKQATQAGSTTNPAARATTR